MCGRYKLQAPDWVEPDFSATFPTLADEVRRPRFNIAPGQLVLAVREGASGRTLEQMKWGIAAPWKGGSAQLINARGEKLATSRFWEPLLAGGRCALPADGFYEWKAPEPGSRRKRPYLFTNRGGGFWLAGLCAPAEDARPAAAFECVVVTVEPNELVADVHDRMPAMLTTEQVDAWLGDDLELARALLAPFPSTQMDALAVGPAVGDASREGPELIEPAREGQIRLL
jgi:putative SOS response-associated peptidase YedK